MARHESQEKHLARSFASVPARRPPRLPLASSSSSAAADEIRRGSASSRGSDVSQKRLDAAKRRDDDDDDDADAAAAGTSSPHDGHDGDGRRRDARETGRHDDHDAQPGATKIEQLWRHVGENRAAMTMLIVAIYAVGNIYDLDGSTTSSYQIVGASAFGSHGKLMGAIDTCESTLIAVSKPLVARVCDVSSRQAAYLAATLLYVAGYAAVAASPNAATFAVGRVLSATGQAGLLTVTDILAADVTPLQWRGFLTAMIDSPYLWLSWVGPNISGALIDGSADGWRWGFGMFCILAPVCVGPIIALLYWVDRKVVKQLRRQNEGGDTGAAELGEASRGSGGSEKGDQGRHKAADAPCESTSPSRSPSPRPAPTTPAPESDLVSSAPRDAASSSPAQATPPRARPATRPPPYRLAESPFRRRWREKHGEDAAPPSAAAVALGFLSDLDAIGLVLLGAAWTLLLLPFSLAPSAKGEWRNPSMIAMLVVGATLLLLFLVWERRLAPTPMLPASLLRNRTFLLGVTIDGFFFLSGSMRSLYWSSYVYVVKDWSTTNWGRYNNAETVALVLMGLVAGLVFRATHRCKLMQLTGLCIRHVGLGVLVYTARTPTPSTAALAMIPVLIGTGGAFSIVATRVSTQASVPHAGLAQVVAQLALCTKLGGSIGSAVASAVWNSHMPSNMAREGVPRELIPEVFGSVKAVHSDYALDDPVRQAVIRAYARTCLPLFVAALCLNTVPLACGFLMPNYYLGRAHNSVEATDTAGRPVVEEEQRRGRGGGDDPDEEARGADGAQGGVSQSGEKGAGREGTKWTRGRFVTAFRQWYNS